MSSSFVPPKPAGPYSPVIRAGDWLIVSGQVAQRDGQLLRGTITEQTTQILAQVKGLLESAGAGLAQVVKTLVFLTDMADFAEMNAAYMRAFGDHRPARSTVAVAALPGGAGMEIEAWAYTGAGGVGAP